MRKFYLLGLLSVSVSLFAQNKITAEDVISYTSPELIPKKEGKLLGYVRHDGTMAIPAKYNIAMFFAEDCNLQQSPNRRVQKYGSADYATVEINKKSYRIDKTGKTVYTYKNSDLGICKSAYTEQKYTVVVLGTKYGLAHTENAATTKVKYLIKPQYEFMHLLEGDDLDNPMVVAVKNDKFGVVNKKNQVIIPFEYNDIKTNYTWKIAKMFQVSQDGADYYYIDINNHAY